VRRALRQPFVPSSRRALLALAIALSCTQAGGQASVPDASRAERLVFLDAHFAGILPPQTLLYHWRREGGGEATLEDDATLVLTRTASGGCCSVHGQYLSGEQAVNLPDIEDARANPVILFFLEQQVRQLQRSTKGSIAHFRRRIRQSLADAASVSAATVHWGGRELPASLVHIAPFLDDPYRARFEREATTEYSFILSDGVPGGVYQLRAALPGADAPRQTLTLAEPEDRHNVKR
jgi:hypothetical protein